MTKEIYETDNPRIDGTPPQSDESGACVQDAKIKDVVECLEACLRYLKFTQAPQELLIENSEKAIASLNEILEKDIPLMEAKEGLRAFQADHDLGRVSIKSHVSESKDDYFHHGLSQWINTVLDRLEVVEK